MWALPVSALWEEGAFIASEESNLGALTNPAAAPTAPAGRWASLLMHGCS